MKKENILVERDKLLKIQNYLTDKKEIILGRQKTILKRFKTLKDDNKDYRELNPSLYLYYTSTMDEQESRITELTAIKCFIDEVLESAK